MQSFESDSKLANSAYFPQINSLNLVTDSMNYFKFLSLYFLK